MRFTFGQFDAYEALVPSVVEGLKAHEIHDGIEDFFTAIDEGKHHGYDVRTDMDIIEGVAATIAEVAFPMHSKEDLKCWKGELAALLIHFVHEVEDSAPNIGAPVSYSFNGDSYPCGTIKRVTPGGQYVTDTGHKFKRHKGCPRSYYRVGGKQWSMIAGHHNDRNPHF